MDKRIHLVINKINLNTKDAWSLAKMAEVANLSVTHFITLFKSEVKMTPVQYLRDKRFGDAKYLLENSFKSVKEIINEVGITDQSHFTKEFTKEHGVSPTKYRKQCWNKLSNE